MKKFLLYILLLLAALPVSSGERSFIDDREDWDFIIKYFSKTFPRRKMTMDKLKAGVDREFKDFDQECAKVDKRCGELTFLLWNRIENEVFGISLYCKQISDLKENFDDHIDSLRKFQQMLQENYVRLQNMKQATTVLNNGGDKRVNSEQLNLCRQAMQAQMDVVQHYIGLCDQRLKTAEQIKIRVDELNRESEVRRKQLMDKVIFNSDNNFISLLKSAPVLFELWGLEIPRWVAIQFPDDPFFWRNILLLTIFIWLPLFLSGRYVFIRLALRANFPEKYAKSRNFMAAWGIFVLSLLCLSTWFMLGEVEFSPFYRAGQFLFAMACLMMSIGIRVDRETMRNCLLLYSPLIAQHLAGMALCTLLIPYSPLIIITPILNLPVIVFTLILLWKLKCPMMDRVFGWLTVFVGIAAMIMGMIGLAYISFTLMLFWFIAVAGIHTGIAITRQFAAYTEEGNRHPILICLLIQLLMPLTWFVIVGGMIYWTAGLYNQQGFLRAIIFNNLTPYKDSLNISMVDLVAAVIVALFLKFAISTVRHLIAVVFAEKAEMGLIPTFMTLGSYLAWACYLLFLIILFDVHQSTILVVLGGMSMGIGFGFKEIVENFLSGVILLAGKQLRPGDVIEFNGIWGKVRKVSVRATVVDTDDNSVITFPNSQVLSKDFRNWTLNRSIIRGEIVLGVCYGSDVQKVIRILGDVLAANYQVMKNPKPDILFADFGESQLTFKIRFWCSVNVRNRTCSDLRVAINEAFVAHGIAIPFPQMDIHIDQPVVNALAGSGPA